MPNGAEELLNGPDNSVETVYVDDPDYGKFQEHRCRHCGAAIHWQRDAEVASASNRWVHSATTSDICRTITLAAPEEK